MSQQKAQLINATENVNLSGGLVVSGVTTAGNFIGSFSGTATGLSGTPNLTLGIITATSFSGDGSNLTGVGVTPFIGVSTAAQSGTTTIDLSLGNVIYFTQDTDTTVAFANTTTTQVIDFIRVKDDTTTARTITWPSSIIWNGGTAPTLIDSALTGEVQIFNLTTRDQGVTWYGYETMKNDPVPPIAYYVGGEGNEGRLGLNDEISRSSPVQVPGTGWSYLARSSGFSHGRKTDGTMWVWGTPNQGTLGLNDAIYRSSPTQLPGTQWTGFSGNYSNVATKTDGTLWSWGWNSYGDLGHNNAVKYSSPKQIPGTQWSVEDCYGNSQVTAARKTDGTLWVWGRNYAGVMGQNQSGGTLTGYSSPRQLPGTQWTSVSLDTSCGFATKSDGTFWSWGYNPRGNLGQNNTVYYSSPTQVPGTQWQKIMYPLGHTSRVMKTDGTLWVWGGFNSHGLLGLNDIIPRSSPTQVPGTWSHVSGRNNSALATKTDDTLWAWGQNDNGQSGLNDIINRSSPTQVPGTWSVTTSTGIFAARQLG
jgi:alpha-tubulin suppressor-like RCC1 family protein